MTGVGAARRAPRRPRRRRRDRSPRSGEQTKGEQRRRVPSAAASPGMQAWPHHRAPEDGAEEATASTASTTRPGAPWWTMWPCPGATASRLPGSSRCSRTGMPGWIDEAISRPGHDGDGHAEFAVVRRKRRHRRVYHRDLLGARALRPRAQGLGDRELGYEAARHRHRREHLPDRLRCEQRTDRRQDRVAQRIAQHRRGERHGEEQVSASGRDLVARNQHKAAHSFWMVERQREPTSVASGMAHYDGALDPKPPRAATSSAACSPGVQGRSRGRSLPPCPGRSKATVRCCRAADRASTPLMAKSSTMPPSPFSSTTGGSPWPSSA